MDEIIDDLRDAQTALARAGVANLMPQHMAKMAMALDRLDKHASDMHAMQLQCDDLQRRIYHLEEQA